MIKVTDLKCELLENALGIDEKKPQFSYKLTASENNTYQKFNEIIILKGDEVVWENKEETKKQLIEYNGPVLKARTKYSYKITVGDNYNNISSAISSFETGKLNEKFKGHFITTTYPDDMKTSPRPIVFKKTFNLKSNIRKARIYITSLGIYHFTINNKEVTDDYFTPGFTSYKNQLQYQVYDIKDFLNKENKILVTVASGWAVGVFGLSHLSHNYSDKMALKCEIHIEYENNKKECIISDDSWLASYKGPYLFADFYNGEEYDARINLEEIEYQHTYIYNYQAKPKLLATYGEKVKKHEVIKPIKMFTSKKGEIIYDLGQNFAGVIKIKLNEDKSTRIVISHAELLDNDGNFYTLNLREARAQIIYICKGETNEEYIPKFTYMGFRYVRIEGATNLDINSLEGIAIYSDVKKTGYFKTSNNYLNQLEHNINWSGKSNFVEIPTDCPQRDERLGWTGDIAVFIRTATFNMNIHRFINKWLLDVISDENKYGGAPFVVPFVNITDVNTPVAGWSDATSIVPWMTYLAYDDVRLLKRQYQSIKNLVEGERKMASLDSTGYERYIWDKGFQFGDWLAPYELHARWQEKARVIGTCYFANSAKILSNIASIIGKTKDAIKYQKLFEKICKSYIKVFFDKNMRLKDEYQSAYVCGLYFNMIPKDKIERVAYLLNEDVKRKDYHLSTGFLGTPYLAFALSDNGYLDSAYKLLLQTTFPSWLYEVKAGATTIWERWDSLMEDGKINDENSIVNMVSFNHYANGAIGDWMYRRLAGLEPTKPGYEEFKIEPMINKEIRNVEIRYDSIYGLISSEYEINDSMFSINVVVPCNTTSTIILPNKSIYKVGCGKYHFECRLEAIK